MESLDPSCAFIDDLLNFSSDIGEEDEDDDKKHLKPLSHSICPNDHELVSSVDVLKPDGDIPETEEELEWILNKDAFPAVETFILTEQPLDNFSKHQSPVSVLENSTSSSNSHNSGTMMSCCGSLQVPVRARSKRRRKRRRVADIATEHLLLSQEFAKSTKTPPISATTIGRKCQHCGAEKTPQWRAGPLGAKTLCNACGVRYKSGRLCPEYRPASSPTFSSKLHSNSHRKIMEMKTKKQTGIMNMTKPVDRG